MAPGEISASGFYRHSLPPRWLNRWALHADRLRPHIHACAGHRHSSHDACHPPNNLVTRRAVTPVDIVELRALDVERNELRAESAASPPQATPSAVRRLWPFRWPTVDPPEAVQPLPIPAAPEKGAYFDVVI